MKYGFYFQIRPPNNFWDSPSRLSFWEFQDDNYLLSQDYVVMLNKSVINFNFHFLKKNEYNKVLCKIIWK